MNHNFYPDGDLIRIQDHEQILAEVSKHNIYRYLYIIKTLIKYKTNTIINQISFLFDKSKDRIILETPPQQ